MTSTNRKTAQNSRAQRNFRRSTGIAILSLLSLAIVVSPAAAAGEFGNISGNALAIIIGVGLLLFAVVFEVWRMTARNAAPIRNRATDDWTSNKHID